MWVYMLLLVVVMIVSLVVPRAYQYAKYRRCRRQFERAAAAAKTPDELQDVITKYGRAAGLTASELTLLTRITIGWGAVLRIDSGEARNGDRMLARDYATIRAEHLQGMRSRPLTLDEQEFLQVCRNMTCGREQYDGV